MARPARAGLSVYSAPNQYYNVTLTVFDLAGQSSSKTFRVYPNSN
jgi:hypothetical protein